MRIKVLHIITRMEQGRTPWILLNLIVVLVSILEYSANGMRKR
jgi:hypothetical protein